MRCKFSDFWRKHDIEGRGKVGTGFRGCGKIRGRTEKTYPFDKLRAGSQGLNPDVFSINLRPD
jgi:hypothetical protein